LSKNRKGESKLTFIQFWTKRSLEINQLSRRATEISQFRLTRRAADCLKIELVEV
jgi:hypothetical protein